MGMKARLLLLTTLSLATLPLAAHGPWHPVADLDGFAVVAPDGVQATGALGLRRTLAGDPREPDAYLQAGALGSLTLAYGTAGAYLEVQPAPFLVLRAERSATRYFGRWGALLFFPSSASPFGDAEMKALKGREEAAWGSRWTLQATPQARLGPLVFRHQLTFAWWRFSGRGPWFYEYENDTLLRDGDRTRDHQTFLSWESRLGAFRTYVGPTWQQTRAMEAGLLRKRWGLALAFEAARPGARWGLPRGGLILGRNQEDRNRKGDLYLALNLGTTFSFR
jgi:hypothetical protein